MMTEPRVILRGPARRINFGAVVDLAPADPTLEFHICRSRHPRTGAPDHLAGAGGAVPREVDHQRRPRPRPPPVGAMRRGDLVLTAPTGTARAAHGRGEHPNHLTTVAPVRRPGAEAGRAG